MFENTINKVKNVLHIKNDNTFNNNLLNDNIFNKLDILKANTNYISGITGSGKSYFCLQVILTMIQNNHSIIYVDGKNDISIFEKISDISMQNQKEIFRIDKNVLELNKKKSVYELLDTAIKANKIIYIALPALCTSIEEFNFFKEEILLAVNEVLNNINLLSLNYHLFLDDVLNFKKDKIEDINNILSKCKEQSIYITSQEFNIGLNNLKFDKHILFNTYNKKELETFINNKNDKSNIDNINNNEFKDTNYYIFNKDLKNNNFDLKEKKTNIQYNEIDKNLSNNNIVVF